MARLRGGLVGILMLLMVDSAGAGGAGEAGASFLRFPVGPRAVGMGESQAAAVEGAYAAYWNPAGLALTEFPEFAMTHNRSLAGVNHQYLSLAWPRRYGSAWNLNITRLSVGSLESYDAQGARTGEVDAGDLAAGIAYGRALTVDAADRPRLSVGGGLKWVEERLGPVNARTFAMDGGLLWVRRADERARGIGAGEWRLALAASNLGPGLKFDSEAAALPMLLRFGAAWRVTSGDDALTVSLDYARGTDEAGAPAFGAEWEVWRMLALRLGFNLGQDIGSGFRGGVGFRLKRFDLGYAFASFGDLGAMHRVGVTMRLGKEVRSKAPRASTLFRQQERENRRYVEEGSKLWKEAAAAGRGEPSREGNRVRTARLAALAKQLELGTRPERVAALSLDGEQASVGAAAVSAYLDGQARKALLLAQAAHGVDRDQEAFAALMEAVAALTYQKPAVDEIYPPAGLVQVKLDKALAAFKDGRYPKAVEQCREALLIEPESAAAYERLGSTYFTMGLQDKAMSAWRESLRLDPENAALKDFLQRLEPAR